MDRLSIIKQEDFLNWLSPITHVSQLNAILKSRAAGTDDWLLDSPLFDTWLKTSGQAIFCRGAIGVGKTVVSGAVIARVQSLFRDRSDVGIIYFFNDCNRQTEKLDSFEVLSSLLRQMTEQQQKQHPLQKSIMRLYKGYYKGNRNTEPSYPEIARVFHSVASRYTRLFVILDGMDGTGITVKERNIILREMDSIQEDVPINLFVTSDATSEPTVEVGDTPILDFRATNEDIERYLEKSIFMLPQFISGNVAMIEKVKKAIVFAADGVFILARLYLYSLIGKPTLEAIELCLVFLHREHELSRQGKQRPELFDTAHRLVMEQIQLQELSQRELAKMALMWVTFARRPLRMLELMHALALEFEDSEFNIDGLFNAGSIKRVCYDLIDVDEGSDSVFIHSSTRDYLVRNQSVWFSDDCQAHIYQKCVAYLCNDLSRNLRSLRNLQDRSSPHALYEYAVYNWGEHARRASTEAVKTVGDILNNTRQMATFGQVLVAPKRRNMDLGHDQDVPENIEATHIAAFFGLEGVMASFITQGNRLDPSDSHGRTPLSYAAQKGYHKIVQLLLREEGINLDSVDANGRTPLSWAAGNGYQEVAQLLLSAGARIETQDSIGRTPLLHAALNGHESLVRLMLKSDSVDTNISDIYGYTALSHAAAMGHECTVKFLLDQPKIHADCKDIYGYTPLSHAATYGHTTVVQLLLVADGVDPDSRDLNGLTPLSLAAGNGCTEVVRLLISIAGVNNDSRDVNGVTPLARAAANGQVSVVRVLIIADGVDLDAKDINGQTPYARAAANGHTVVAHILQSAIESR